MTRIKVGPWWVVFAAIVVLAYSMGARQALGLMLPEISQSLSISLSELSFGFAIQNLLWGAAAPDAGMLAERFGTVRVVLGGAVLYGVVFVIAAIAASGL